MPLSPVSLATTQILSFSLCVCITFLNSQGDGHTKTGKDLCEGRVEKAGVGTGGEGGKDLSVPNPLLFL